MKCFLFKKPKENGENFLIEVRQDNGQALLPRFLGYIDDHENSIMELMDNTIVVTAPHHKNGDGKYGQIFIYTIKGDKVKSPFCIIGEHYRSGVAVALSENGCRLNVFNSSKDRHFLEIWQRENAKDFKLVETIFLDSFIESYQSLRQIFMGYNDNKIYILQEDKTKPLVVLDYRTKEVRRLN